MTWRLALKPQADRDITNQFEFIAKDNLEAAIRFYEAAFRAFDILRANPTLIAVASKKEELIPHFFRRSYFHEVE
jgi:plasmid stabilization system protein ParE